MLWFSPQTSMIKVMPISPLFFLPYIVKIWLSFFLCVSGRSFLSVMRNWVEKPQQHVAPGVSTNLHSYTAHQRGRVGLTFCLSIAEAVAVFFPTGPPTVEWGQSSFLKIIFCKERGHCCLLCPMFLMLLTSASTTLILSATFSMIEFKSLQMLMDSKGPIRTHKDKCTHTHNYK